MDKYKKLLSNSIIFAIGNFGSKMINLILVPLYTFALSAEDYGKIDILNTTVGLVIPIISLLIGQSVLRFILDNSQNRLSNEEIFSNGLFITVLGSMFSLSVLPIILTQAGGFKENNIFFIAFIIVNIYADLLSQFCRSMGKVKEFAVNGIIMTLITAVLNLFLLLYLNMGIVGYFISSLSAGLISIVYLGITTQFYNFVSIKMIKKETMKEMLSYSLPMIPNSVMWWLVNGTTRYIILFFIGPIGNGLFAVANKLPSIISMITSIFQQAWQLSAFEEYDSKDNNLFYSKVFEWYYLVLFLGGSGILLITKPLFRFFIENSYYSAWEIVPFLVLAAIYQTLSAYLGTTYTSSMHTKGLFTTTVYAGLIAVIVNLIFIPLFGVSGAGLGNFLSFFLLFLIRLYDTKKWIKISINKVNFISLNIIYILQTILLFLSDSIYAYIIQIFLFICVIYFTKNILFNFIKIIIGRRN